MQRLYRQLYHKLKDKIHTTPDTPEIRQVKKTQEAVSEVGIFLGERGGHGTQGWRSHWSLIYVFMGIFPLQLIYKSDFFKMQGHMISMPYTPHVLHCRYVGDITSDVSIS